MSQPIQSCFERYEKKYFLTPAGQKALLQTIDRKEVFPI